MKVFFYGLGWLQVIYRARVIAESHLFRSLKLGHPGSGPSHLSSLIWFFWPNQKIQTKKTKQGNLIIAFFTTVAIDAKRSKHFLGQSALITYFQIGGR